MLSTAFAAVIGASAMAATSELLSGNLPAAALYVGQAFGGAFLTCLVEAFDERDAAPTSLKNLAIILTGGFVFALLFGTAIGKLGGLAVDGFEDYGPAVAGLIGFGMARTAPSLAVGWVKLRAGVRPAPGLPGEPPADV